MKKIYVMIVVLLISYSAQAVDVTHLSAKCNDAMEQVSNNLLENIEHIKPIVTQITFHELKNYNRLILNEININQLKINEVKQILSDIEHLSDDDKFYFLATSSCTVSLRLLLETIKYFKDATKFLDIYIMDFFNNMAFKDPKGDIKPLPFAHLVKEMEALTKLEIRIEKLLKNIAEE